MRRILLSALVLVAAGAFLVLAGGASNGSGTANGTYTVELDNAFGLVTGADFKVAGVRAGTIKAIDLDQKTLHAAVKIQVTQPGFGQFHTDAACQSRPQSLIGEYFLGCEPGTPTAPVLPPGGVIPVTHTSSTIAPDLLNDIMRLPYRERFTLIINELGAGVAGRTTDLQSAIHRAVPALTETDNLLHLLANDSNTLQDLTVNSDSVITALANNAAGVNRFIVEAGNAASDSAARSSALQATWHKLPGFLEQLRPAMQKLGQSADANTPVFANLNQASSELSRFFTDLVPFSNSSRISLNSLGKASVTGKQAAQAAGPTVAHLNTFAKTTPELGQNLAIVLHDLDDRGRAVEKDVRSPGGQGYTGLEALLQYVYNQTLAVNTFTPFGHELTVDAFSNSICAAYQSPASLAASLKTNGAAARQCYAWLGPNQPGINEPDPSNPGGACPDPGAVPPNYPGANIPATGPKASCRKLTAADTSAKASRTPANKAGAARLISSSTAGSTQTAQANAGGTAGKSRTGVPAISLKNTLGGLLGLFGGGSSPTSAAAGVAGAAGSATGGGQQSQTSQLLKYLLAP